MEKRMLLRLLAASLFMTGCMTIPTGPTVLVLPGQQKSFEHFRDDDIACQQYAWALTAPVGQAAADAAVSPAVVATAIGAAAGAIIGSATGRAGQGAAIGAGTGLVFGSSASGHTAYLTSYELQRRYNMAYVQCMYSRGNQVPGSAVYRQAPANYLPPGAPPPGYPPPGTPAPDLPPQPKPPPNYPPPNTLPPEGVPPQRK